MEELFSNIPDRVREQTRFWIDMALIQPNLIDGIKMIEDYRNASSEEEKEYIDFAVAVRMEQLLHANNSN